jgi:hypothetical protein
MSRGSLGTFYMVIYPYRTQEGTHETHLAPQKYPAEGRDK